MRMVCMTLSRALWLACGLVVLGVAAVGVSVVIMLATYYTLISL